MSKLYKYETCGKTFDTRKEANRYARNIANAAGLRVPVYQVNASDCKPTNKEQARMLRSAASALEHGRFSTAQKKLAQVFKVQEPVVFIEGGIVQSVLIVDAKQKTGYWELPYEVVDYDTFDGSSNKEISEYWDGFSAELKNYFEKHLKSEYAMFQEAIAETKKEASAK